jgi:hypothetical protein
MALINTIPLYQFKFYGTAQTITTALGRDVSEGTRLRDQLAASREV